METTELPLFTFNNPQSEAKHEPVKITEQQIITPLVEVLNNQSPTSQSQSISSPKSVIQALDELFPEQQREEKRIQKTKEILGKVATEFTTEQLRDVMAEVQYLADSWLDDFERKQFGGLTLNELLHEKGNS